MEVQLQSFLTFAIDGGDYSSSRPDRFIPGKEGQYALRSGLVAVEIRENTCKKPNHDPSIVQPAA